MQTKMFIKILRNGLYLVAKHLDLQDAVTARRWASEKDNRCRTKFVPTNSVCGSYRAESTFIRKMLDLGYIPRSPSKKLDY